MSADIWEAFGNAPSTSQRKQVTLLSSKEASDMSRMFSITNGQPGRTDDREALWKIDKGGADVLFDALEDGSDDFGDFEDAEPKETQAKPYSSAIPVHTGIDLLDLADLAIDQPRSGDHVSGMVLDKSEHLSQPALLSTQTAWQSSTEVCDDNDDDEQWGTFEDAEPGETPSDKKTGSSPRPTTHTKDSPTDMGDDWDSFEDLPAPVVPHSGSEVVVAVRDLPEKAPANSQSISRTQARPTNIPPPFLLLQILPSAFENLAKVSSTSQEHLSDAAVAQRVVDVYCVTARIISGRSHRWKRDSHLSQSMRISQAGVKSSGMKLTSLNRGEAIKEDQQVLEVMSAWAHNSYRLNALLAKGKLKKPPMQLSANMNIRAASGAGILTAKDVCPVCGLKRNERVLGIDISVEDTFGEFWIEYWGHRDCYDFWYRSRDLLDHR